MEPTTFGKGPIVEVVEYALGKGYEVKVFDRNVAVAKLMGGNKAFIEQQIPHISSLFVQRLDELVNDCDVIVIGNRDDAFREALTPFPDGKVVIDLVRMFEEVPDTPNYDGLCW